MAVVKYDKNERKRFGQPASTADTGITWATSSRPSAVEYRDGHIRKTVITVPSLTWATTTASKGNGQAIYTFPEGFILPVAARIVMSTTTGAATSTVAGEVGLGTTVASGAVSVLSGTAAFQNILDGKTLSNQVASTALATSVTDAAGGTSGTQAAIDGSATAATVYLNHASAYTGTAGLTLNSATVTIWWIDLGDA